MTKAATLKTISAVELRSMLGPGAADAVVDEAALAVVPHLGVRLLQAVGVALAEVRPTLAIRAISGYSDPEDRNWTQLVLDVSGAEPGTPEWEANLDAAGRTMELVAERCPDLGPELSAIGFHF